MTPPKRGQNLMSRNVKGWCRYQNFMEILFFIVPGPGEGEYNEFLEKKWWEMERKKIGRSKTHIFWRSRITSRCKNGDLYMLFLMGGVPGPEERPPQHPPPGGRAGGL